MVPKDPSAETAQAGPLPAATGGAFRAFISYSHRDTKAAEWLHKALETYRVPKPLIGRETTTGLIAARPGRIFRDRDELEVAADLSGKINEALKQSQFLIVLCSRASAASKWVNQEVINFKRLKGADRIIAVIVDGEPGGGADECFVPALRFKVSPAGDLTDERAEPIAADLRPGKDTKARVRLKVVAGLLGVGLDELIRRDSQRRARFFFYTSVAMGCASLLLAYLTVDAIRSRNLAVAAQTNADRKRAQAEDLIEFLIGDLRTKLEPVGRLDVLDAVGQKALDHFSSLRPEEQDDEALARRARALQLLGTIAINKGSLPEAEKLLLEALTTTKLLLDRDPTNSQRLYEYGEAASRVGALFFKKVNYDTAREHYAETLDIAKRLNAKDAPKRAWQAQLAKAWLNLGIISTNLLDAKRAVEELQTAFDAFSAISRQEPANTSWKKELGSTLEWMASSYFRAGEYRKAMEIRQRQVELYTNALAGDPDNKVIKTDLIIALRSLANINLNFGDTALARAKLAQALALVTSLTDLDPGNADWKSGQARILLDLVDADIEAEDLANTAQYLRRVNDLGKELSAADPTILSWQIDIVHRGASFQARYDIAVGRPADAISVLRAHAPQMRALREKIPNEASLRDRAMLAEKYRGIALELMGNKREASDAFFSILKSSAYNPNRFDIQAASTHVVALYHLGRLAEAYPIMQRIETTGFRRREFLEAYGDTTTRLKKGGSTNP